MHFSTGNTLNCPLVSLSKNTHKCTTNPGHGYQNERRYSPELLLTVLTSRCDFAEGSPPGLMVCTTQERLKIGTLYT